MDYGILDLLIGQKDGLIGPTDTIGNLRHVDTEIRLNETVFLAIEFENKAFPFIGYLD